MCCPSRTDGAPARDSRHGELKRTAKLRATIPSTWASRGSTRAPPTQSAKSWRRGIASFKVFLAYKGAFGIDDDELYQTLKLAKELGVIVTAHCENETSSPRRRRRLLAEGKTGPECHDESRPPRVEAEGVHHLMTFAEMTGASRLLVHTSCREALEAVHAAHACAASACGSRR